MAELASPPEFGTNGAPPPLHSAPILVGHDYFLTKAPTGRRALWALLTGHLSGTEFSDARRWIQENCHAGDVAGLVQDSPSAVAGLVRNLRNTARKRKDHDGEPGVSVRNALGVGGGILLASILTPGLAGVAAGAVAGSKLYKNRKKSAAPHAVSVGAGTNHDEWQLNRVVCTKRWKRHEDHIVQLPPGSRRTTVSQITVGVSTEKSEELSLALGLGTTIQLARLNSELSAKLGRTITLTEERQTSESLELSNDGNSTSYRRFALWHPEYTLRVSALVGTGEAISWRDRTTVTFVPPSAVALTCTDVEPRRERVPMSR